MRVLIVDLNNFSRFPTLGVGLIAGVLRSKGHEVEVLSPFATGMPGLPRAERAPYFGLWDERLRWWTATTSSSLVRVARSQLEARRRPDSNGRSKRFETAFAEALARKPHAVLVSTYLMYRDLVARLARLCQVAGMPVIIGGPAFHALETRRAWGEIDGLSGIYAGEGELHIEALLRALVDGANTTAIPGFTARGGTDAGMAEPMRNLDDLPFPDYTGFPWDLYPNRIASVLTGRGCGWGVCRFCSDVVTVAGRGFRSRSPGNVLAELDHLHRTHGVSLFCFSDLKLNSDLAMWRGLHAGIQRVVPGAQWTCAVHAGPRADEGLGEADMLAARRAGLVRITTGLESGSQGQLESMGKGTSIKGLTSFLHAAKRAGISTRLTAFTGYPGEAAQDVLQTAAFLHEHRSLVDRVHLSRFLIQSDTPIDRALSEGGAKRHGIFDLRRVPADALVRHVDQVAQTYDYRLAISRLLSAVHRINRKPLDVTAIEFEGAM